MNASTYVIAALLLDWSWVCYSIGVREGRAIEVSLILKYLRDEEPAKPATRQQVSVLQALSLQLGFSFPRKNFARERAYNRIEERLATK